MTTIAANISEMAADSKVTDGEVSFPTDKLTIYKGAIIGCAGDNKAIRKFWDWYKAGGKSKKAPDFDADATLSVLRLDKTGLWCCDTSLWWDRINNDVYAVGSGNQLALHLMKKGSSPEEAIHAACETDNNTGCPVQVIRLADVKRKRR
jgi:hypothetical protein